jgi:hypothetical protein
VQLTSPRLGLCLERQDLLERDAEQACEECMSGQGQWMLSARGGSRGGAKVQERPIVQVHSREINRLFAKLLGLANGIHEEIYLQHAKYLSYTHPILYFICPIIVNNIDDKLSRTKARDGRQGDPIMLIPQSFKI